MLVNWIFYVHLLYIKQSVMAQFTNKLEFIRVNLPLGGKKEISERTGLNIRTVGRILKGESSRYKNLILVIRTAEDIINDLSNLSN